MNLVKRMTNENSKRMIAILLLTAMLFSLIVPVQTESAYAASNISVGTKVNLKTWVKVKEDWQEDNQIVKKFKLDN